MGHAFVENRTPFAFQTAFAADEEGLPLMTAVVKASYLVSASGHLQIADKQLPVNFAGEFWGEPGRSSYKYEPECAFMKPSTDVILIGHAHARAGHATEVYVRFRVGLLDQTIRVVGDRYWIQSFGMTAMTSPEPFERIPLIYERAFGGWDRSHPDPTKHTFEALNPVGTGFRSKHGTFQDGLRLPNLEDPKYPIREYGSTSRPASLGFTSPDWQPRAAFGGTYDSGWMETRMPLLPADFDRRFFNAASPGLIAPDYLRGDEPVFLENASPRGAITFQLPGVRPPECRVQLSGSGDARVTTNLDTVIVNTDDDLVLLIWRGYLPVRNGPHDIVSIQIRAEGVSAPAAAR